MEIWRIWLEVCAVLLEIYGLYSGILMVFTLFPRKKYPQKDPKTRFAVVIAARDEAPVIGDTVQRLLRQTYPGELYDIYVVPNNCTDDTAGVAEKAGATILHCTEPVRDKGGALRWAFRQLEPMGYDAYCVFDADNQVFPDFLARMNDAFLAGARIAKGIHRASNPTDSYLAGCYDLYFENFHLMFSRPRAWLGLSAKLMGTGFAVSRELLQEMGGFNTKTLTEDTEFAVLCAMHGERIWYVPDAITLDEQPNDFKTSTIQRRRWSSGVITTLRTYWRELMKNCFKRGRWLFSLDMLMMLMGPIMQFVGVFPALNLVIGAVVHGQWLALGIGLASFWGGMSAMALVLTILGRRKLRGMVKAILLYPWFLLTWYPISVLSVIYPARIWRPIAHGQRKKDKHFHPAA